MIPCTLFASRFYPLRADGILGMYPSGINIQYKCIICFSLYVCLILPILELPIKKLAQMTRIGSASSTWGFSTIPSAWNLTQNFPDVQRVVTQCSVL